MDAYMQDVYFTNQEMKQSFEEIEGLSLHRETNTYYDVYDEYDGRMVRFHKDHFEITTDMIEAYKNEIEEFDIFACLYSLPKVMMMNVKKIFFVKNTKDVVSITKEYGSLKFDFAKLGKFDIKNGIIVINIQAHEKELESSLKNNAKKEVVNYEILLKENIWKTLVYYLYRSLQSNPLLKGLLDTSEEATREFLDELFDKTVSDDDKGVEIPIALDFDELEANEEYQKYKNEWK